ncbi:TPA: YfbU family protein [Enterococcus faecium]|uniref:YfbU family protein n=1 Tax=Enterococcus TaxID=1350 RepID=UPI00177D08AA|nr:YfbU family protein [Enterococcus faecium]MBD9760948.1 YfbU family protein [Enterococcus faecium]MBD9784555.1 YfbU family protein [Enterococcus faecium]HAP8955145.1 YfbU family protein [Enterococcus faecium]
MDKFQRLSLVNQFELLAKFDDQNRSYYERKIEILREGYEYHYDDEIWSDLSEPLPKEDSRFVLDVLNMYRDINFSKSKLNLDENQITKSYYTHFLGFDYNDPKEIKLAFYAKFFIEKLDRFPELVEDKEFEGFNSHQLMTNTYNKYLSNYKEIKHLSNYKFGNLSVDLINRILGE